MTKSHLHKITEEFLTEKGVAFESEHFDMYFIDIACPEQKVAIEIAGPNHYVLPAKTLNGSSLLKNRNLKALGWNTCVIPFY